MATLQEALALAIHHHQSGQLGLAGTLYRRILEVAPDHADAMHLLGLTGRRLGRGGAAFQLIRRSLRLNPDLGAAHLNLGNLLRDAGQADAAAASYRRAVAVAPDMADAYRNLAGVPHQQALTLHRRVIRLRPDWSEGYNGLANTLQEQDRAATAVATYRAGLALEPAHAAACNNLGIALRSLGRLDGALTVHRHAILIDPGFAAAHTSLGLTLHDLGRLGEADARHRRALTADPAFLGAMCNLGTTRLAQNRAPDAVRSYRRAITLDPASPDSHRNLGMALLVSGALGEGWREYEWRLRCKDAPTHAELPRPRWRGEPLEGRSILIHSEQGLGDAIQFCRYAPLVAARGGRVLLGVPPILTGLLNGFPGVDRVVSGALPMGAFDVHAPLLSLPEIFGTTMATIPAAVPYLQPQPDATAAWAERLAGHDGLRIGVVWAGSPGHANDRNRSLPLAALAPLSAIPGVTLFSIQKGPAEAEAASPPAGMRLVNLSPDIGSFLDTAAIVANLDLVVCVDTSVAHLAGALARPVWVLLPFAPDWRWLLDREDTPWYPTMRLFRQSRPGDWSGVLTRLETAIRSLA